MPFYFSEETLAPSLLPLHRPRDPLIEIKFRINLSLRLNAYLPQRLGPFPPEVHLSSPGKLKGDKPREYFECRGTYGNKLLSLRLAPYKIKSNAHHDTPKTKLQTQKNP